MDIPSQFTLFPTDPTVGTTISVEVCPTDLCELELFVAQLAYGDSPSQEAQVLS